MLIKNIILIAAYAICVTPDTPKNYGTFNLTITQFDMCRGPKKNNCALSKAYIANYSSIQYDLQVLHNITPTKGKITAMTNGKEFLRLQVKKPCEHLFLRPLFSSFMNVTKDCVIVKGHYNFSLDIKKIAQQYFGGTFLFGNWTFKSLFYNETCNFSCAVIQVMLLPLDKEN